MTKNSIIKVPSNRVSKRNSIRNTAFEEIHIMPVDYNEQFSLMVFSRLVEPENDFEDVFQEVCKSFGSTFCLDPLQRWDHNRKSISFPRVKGIKRVYLVPHDTFNLNDEERHLNKYGLTICKNPINYLLGIVRKVPEKLMPPFTKNKAIIALHQAIKGRYTNYAYLGIKRSENDRGFHEFEKDFIHQIELFEWMILAEDIGTGIVPVN